MLLKRGGRSPVISIQVVSRAVPGHRCLSLAMVPPLIGYMHLAYRKSRACLIPPCGVGTEPMLPTPSKRWGRRRTETTT